MEQMQQLKNFHFWLVSVRTINGHACAGTIINEWWILTGANCIKDEPIADLTILHSSTYLRSTGPNIIQAEKYIIHEGFNASNTFIHDIAVIKLKSPMQIKLFDFKVKLAVKGALYTTGKPAVFAGWGKNSTYGDLTTTLQKVDFQLYSANDCTPIMNAKVHPTQICAGPIGGNSRVCKGDGGGALLVNGVNIASSSWMYSICLQPPYVSVFTQIGPYIDWIREKTGVSLGLNMFLSL
ncbi:mite allergen Der p 3-like isoform X2 [Chironomus tepperi]|uniref:mite allergen Der p 3-like isoform X2 n=1 Tax=Chironomus tepperi TaxID=113505 RepID=UPI00391F4EBA